MNLQTKEQGKEFAILCEKCGEHIPDSQFRKHKIEHQLGKLDAEPLINPATGKPDGEPMTPPDFIKGEIKNNKEALQDKSAIDGLKPATVVPVKGIETKEPITIRYVMTGTCPTCNESVKTIELKGLPDKDKTTVVAYCLKEDKNIQQRIVAKI